ncbi:DUF4128 domain-containing protein [Acidovorax sp. MR-S7]|uniref:DUF4128 domain-containing protein n=1 Tax=Acidovorax sp. MR-S7 TaxID=1268622 RepID=UPI000380B4FF|nr:DUF4128 domain-containing protein [Acidovorax sp. MR-S7]GAD20959.1 hypothetical protein AVS7_00720 [Acidovorax sp. MR-S7]
MSIAAIQSALEKRLLALSPQLPTAWENVTFTPPSSMWQRVNHLINAPRDLALERTLRLDRGIFQVTVHAPINTGRLAAMQRAELIRDHFAPVLMLTEGAVRVDIVDTPRIASPMADEPWWAVPVSVYWSAFIAT